MVTQSFRPDQFKKVVGQDLVKQVLKAIVNKPLLSPKSIILEGKFGCGKTSLARVFAKALNCKNPKNSEPCLKCESCLNFNDSHYIEYDTTVVGNVETIRSLRDTFFYSVSEGYKVIVFDEIQTASQASQSALLKCIEEAPKRTFFIFCTTHVDKILPTIKSRSLELRLELVKPSEMKPNLEYILNTLKFPFQSDTLDLIVDRSEGHIRDAHMLLDKLMLLGEEDFNKSVKSAKNYFLKLLCSAMRSDLESFKNNLNQLSDFPLSYLKKDFQQIILNLTQSFVSNNVDIIEDMLFILGRYKQDFFSKFIKTVMSDFILSSFDSEINFKIAMLSLYQSLGTVNNSSQIANNRRVVR